MSITTDSDSAARDGRIGVFVLIAIVFLMGSYLWFKAINPWNPQQRFEVQWHEVAALNDNAPVLVNGVRVGSVESIHLKGKEAVHVKLQINMSKIVIPQGASFRILSNNVVGVKYVDITLPILEKGKPAPEPLTEDMLVVGIDPGRPELVIDSLTSSLNKVSFDELEKKIAQNLDDISIATSNISKASAKLGPVADKTISMEDKVSGLADEVKVTSRRINKIIDNPKFSADLKETASRARDVAISIQKTMKQIDGVLADRELRTDVKEALSRLSDATLHVQHGIETFEKLAQDKEVRTDLKAIVVEARHTLDKVDNIVNSPEFGGNLKDTLAKTHEAIDNVNTVTKQVNQILNKRSPLLHMLFGRPGKLSVQAKQMKKSKDADANSTTTTSTTTAEQTTTTTTTDEPASK
ncbi:MAG: MCE family protein [Candidatus Melainabacteria bacterium]|jgi:phospholipid/cholesterol/gamma-HCH transport system substrate-binding protein|nr:MCE family protein [Candidatus Melainabacteria bacterium]